MERGRFEFKFTVRHAAGQVRSWIVLGTVALSCLGNLTSCNREKKESAAGSGTTESGKPAPEKKAATTTQALSAPALDQIAKMCALVKVPGQPDHPGILLESAVASSSSHRYLVLCDTPQDLESTYVAYRTANGIEKSSAKRMTTLSAGLSIYEFATKSTVTCNHPGDPVPGETWHAIRLTAEGSINDAERTAINSELTTVRAQRTDTQKALTEATRARMERGPMGGNPRDPRSQRGPRQPPPGNEMEQETAATRDEMAALSAQESKLRSRLQFPISSISVTETAAATTRESLESAGGALDNTLLATSSNAVRSIRHGGKWFDLKELLSSVSDQLDQVTLRVSHSSGSVELSVNMKSGFSLSKNSYSLVAATTFGLESMGSGSLEERLARVEPVAFQGGGGSYSVTQRLDWNEQKSTLWLKVFDDRKPETPVIDEVILLDYPESFSARWGKPPSPLIKLPPADPDSPADLVRERLTLDARGEIHDIVAAGDGSVVMIQTKRPPFWAPLNLKTGQWATPPWKPTADTLLATQAGKIYLIDRNTHVMEIWDLASGKRDGMQLLPVEGPVIAAAAPLLDASQPLMVATDRNAFFLDPRKFEIMASGLDLESCFAETSGGRRNYTTLKPATISLRASHDGTLYSLAGVSAKEVESAVSRLTITVDRSSVVLGTSSDRLILPSRGRQATTSFPDHGGNGTSLRSSSSYGQFPGSPGEIRFMDSREQRDYATMKSPPLVPTSPEKLKGYLVPDRGLYYDSRNEVLLLPDGDKLHLVRVNPPEQANQLSGIWFPGEVVEIPLPAGSGHTLKSDLGGEVGIGPTSAKWIIPSTNNRSEAKLKLEWTGELGSSISKDYRIRIVKQTLVPRVESSDGRKKIPLAVRGAIRDEQGEIKGFAGSGQVMLTGGREQQSAWNLADCTNVFSRKGESRDFFGDADRLYVLGEKGALVSYDIQSGRVMAELNLGHEITGITTGISSRGPLLAAEREESRPYVMLIDRDTLKSKLMDFSEENAHHFFIPNFETNPAGSVTWSSNIAVLRDNRAITVKPFEDGFDGVPDATGHWIVCKTEIVDISSIPAKRIKLSSIPGLTDASRCKLDESGRYLLMTVDISVPDWRTASIRDLQTPAKELFKLVYPVVDYDSSPRFISGSKTLVQKITGATDPLIGVYDFDIPEIIKELSH